MVYPPFKCRLKCQCLSNIATSIVRVKREIPMIFELLVTLFIVCILLLMDILWLGRVHSKEIQELDKLHNKDLSVFRKQFDVQMHAVKNEQLQLGADLEKAHVDHINKMKTSHQEELEKKISSILSELNSLKSLSKNYWEKHAEHVDSQFGVNKNDVNDVKKMNHMNGPNHQDEMNFDEDGF